MCVGADVYVCSMPICSYIHVSMYMLMCVFLCGGVHLYVYMCQKKLQQIHMYLINADDNTPKAWKKQTAIKASNNTITVRFLNGAIS